MFLITLSNYRFKGQQLFPVLAVKRYPQWKPLKKIEKLGNERKIEGITQKDEISKEHRGQRERDC